jgi:hypothetical protein
MTNRLAKQVAFGVLSLMFHAHALAAFHFWQVSEIYSNADGSIQFVEFFSPVDSQQFIAGQTIRSTDGVTTRNFVFPSNLQIVPPITGTANRRFLIATQGFANLGIVTPDFIVPSGFLFNSNATVSFVNVDSVPYSSLPTDGISSLNRHQVVGMLPTYDPAQNSPTNFSGATGTIVPPVTVPGAPTNLSATAGNGSVSIAFTPPVNNGGSMVSFYTATCSAGQPTTSSGSPITVSSLTAGVAVTCSVTAHNAAGVSAPSASAVATPFGPPGAPQNVMATRGNGQATITFSPPASDGSSAISGYVASCSPAGGNSPTGASSPLFVTGLSNGTTYQCAVRAQNTAGFGPSSAGVSVTVGTVPFAPSIFTIAPGDRQGLVVFNHPTYDGGFPIRDFIVTCESTSPPSIVTAINPFPSGASAVIRGLTNGVQYACVAAARSDIGIGASSFPAIFQPSAAATLYLFGGVSRKKHLAVGDVDLPISIDEDFVEPRISSSGGHLVVLNYSVAISNPGTMSVVDANLAPIGKATLVGVFGNEVHVLITDVPERKLVSLYVQGAQSVASGSMQSSTDGLHFRFSPGDVNGSGRVSAADISATKARTGTVNAANARFDINLDGTISSSDTSIVKSKSGTVAP